MSLDRPRFSRAAMQAGMRDCLPLLVGLVPFALVAGILAQGDGLSVFEAMLMSAMVYAGSAQLLVLAHWSLPPSVVAAVVATLIINLRLALMGPVLGPWLDRVRGWRLWASLFVMADQNWAMSVAALQAGRADAGYLFGSGALMWAVWIVFTGVGFVLGSAMRPPPGHPIFFAALAVFVSILVVMWRGKSDVLPWVVSALVASAVAWAFPGGSWHIVAGALAGSAAGVWRDRRA